MPVEITHEMLRGMHREMVAGVTKLAEGLEQLAKIGTAAGVPGLDVPGYEGMRKLEEFMHRVGDVMQRVMTLTPENLERLAGAAAKKQGLRVVEGGADAGGE